MPSVIQCSSEQGDPLQVLVPVLLLCQMQSQAVGNVDRLDAIGSQNVQEGQLQLSGNVADVCK